MKQVYITDPCYILTNEDWQKCLKESEKHEDSFVAFDEIVAKRLQEISKDEKAVAGRTGVGDWTNQIVAKSEDTKISNPNFAADSGMVCAVAYTRDLYKYLVENKVKIGNKDQCLARIHTPDEAIYELDYSNPEWTVVKIWLGNSEKLLAESLEN